MDFDGFLWSGGSAGLHEKAQNKSDRKTGLILVSSSSSSSSSSYHFNFPLISVSLAIMSDVQLIIPKRQAQAMMKFTLQGLIYLHENEIIHRDLKVRDLFILLGQTL